MLLLLVGVSPHLARKDVPHPVSDILMLDSAVPPTPARKLPKEAEPSGEYTSLFI